MHDAFAEIERARQRLVQLRVVVSRSTSISATGNSIVCSLKRDSRGQLVVGIFAPSTRSCLKPFFAAHLARSV